MNKNKNTKNTKNKKNCKNIETTKTTNNTKTTKTTKTRNHKGKTQRKKEGGEAIGAGGYGCVFFPAIPCESDSVEEGIAKSRHRVSKLMTNQDVQDEYSLIEQIKPYLIQIPDYPQYFLIQDIEQCRPKALTEEDMKMFSQKCKSFMEKGYTPSYINSHLNQFMAIQMPYGGQELTKFIKTNLQTPEDYVELNEKMTDLVFHGIIPMNRLDVYHGDIKASNILVRVVNGKYFPKLIDWSLSMIFPKDMTKVGEPLINHSFQFNSPFSKILFNDIFMEQYTLFLLKNKTRDLKALRTFVNKYLKDFVIKYGKGHIHLIDKMLWFVRPNQSLEGSPLKARITNYDYGETYYYATEYIVAILLEFTERGKLNLMEYIKKVYLPISDVYGLITSYFYMAMHIHEFTDASTLSLAEKNENTEVVDFLNEIMFKYLFQPRTSPYNLDELWTDLEALSDRFTTQFHGGDLRALR